MMITFLMSGMCYGQIFNGYIDTVYFTNNKKVVCKIKKETDSLLIYQTNNQGVYEDWRISKIRISKYIDKVPGDEFQTNIVEFNHNTKFSLGDNKIILRTLKDSINYLMNKNNSLSQQQARIAVNFGNVSIAGNRIKNAGIFSIIALGTGIISGFCIGFNQEATTPEYALNAGYIFGGIAAVCSIAVPIELITSGKKLKNLK